MTPGPSKPESVTAARRGASHQVREGVALDVSSAARVPGGGEAPNPAQLLSLQRAIGNAAVTDLLQRSPVAGGTRPASPVTVARGRPGRVQRVREGEFRADPPKFLKKNKVTVEMAKGLQLRYPDPGVHAMFYTNFVAKMDEYKFSRHWFVLQHNSEEGTYIVTPAIEKYLEYAPEWEEHVHPKLLAAVKKGPAGPAVKEYITAAYFPYLIGSPSTKDFGGTMGHSDLPKEPSKAKGSDEFNPDFAFTGFMNGCALSVTPVRQDPTKFTIWHFQSSTVNNEQASTFRMEMGPIDWFGEDEYYPRSVEAEGIIPKVTNFLYRKDGAWQVASQVNYSESATGRITKGAPSAPVTRALNVDGAGAPPPLAKLKGIYVDGIQNAINTRMRHAFDACHEHQKLITPAKGIDKAFYRFEADIELIVGDEEQKLRKAKSLLELHEVALGMRKNRDQNDEIINKALNTLHTAYVTLAKEESEKFFLFKEESLRAAYAGMRARLEEIRSRYNESNWIDELVKETTPPPSSDDVRGQAPVVAGLEVPPDSASPQKESPGRSDPSSVGSAAVADVVAIALPQLQVVAANPAVFAFLDQLDPQWNVAAVPRGGGDGAGGQQMIVGESPGVMLGDVSQAKDLAPVGGETLPDQVGFLRNNGSGALCFVYSVVMGLTGLPQAAVEGTVRQIVLAAGVQGGWIATDSAAARQVLDAVQQILGVGIQVVELQNSATGFIISGRSHNVARSVLRPVVLRNTGAHYDAVV